MNDIDTYFLCEGCQPAEEVAHRLADFIRTANRTLDISIYSFRLSQSLRDIVVSALRDREDAGVRIRIAYDAGAQKDPDLIKYPSNDFADMSTPEFVESLGFPCKGIWAERALMHNKYVIVDADSPDASVWTGSANFTEDGWSAQENNILVLRSQSLARLYTHDFNDMWDAGNLVCSGNEKGSGEATLEYQASLPTCWQNMSPCEGEWIDKAITQQVERTRERVTFATVVLTSGNILEALHRLMEQGVPMDGVYDRTQMEGVKYQWEQVPDNHWKIGAFHELVEYGNLVGKDTIPWTPESRHDFMHNKVLVLDDVVVTGSYNFSRHAQKNAENSLMIHSAALAQTYREYIYGLRDRYAGRK
jgi:phosphatidylserine/phosphatidylglycerophosphate/cardiolipin synthase-like enzyme